MNAHARRELEPPEATLSRGSLGPDVKRLQEWLCLHGHHTAVDGDFGPATEAALKAFQWGTDAAPPALDGKPVDFGYVSERWWAALTEPLRRVVDWERTPPLAAGAEVVACARTHLAAKPLEVGSPNAGPWVRHYCRGHEVPWCAGFATAVLGQALGRDEWYTLSCDELAHMAHARGLLIYQPSKEWRAREHIKPGNLFLLRRTDRWPHDWIHCGIVTAVGPDYFETIEGNTNTNGSREGTAVHARVRAFGPNVDFVLTGGDRT